MTYDDITDQHRVKQRLERLARIGEELSMSLDYEKTLLRVADLVLPSLGDFGFFDLVEARDADGQPTKVRRIARAPGDPRRQAILDAGGWIRAARQDINLCALSSGASALHPVIDDAWLIDVATSPEHLAAMRALGFTSMISVPLRYETRILGALTLFMIDPARAFSAQDLSFAEQLADQSAAALENARLYRDLLAKEAAVTQTLVATTEADRRKDEFLAMLGHELRNPLAPIVTALQLMRLTRGRRRPRERGGIIERQVRHLVRLVDDLLDVSRIARGKVALRREPVDLRRSACERGLEIGRAR